MYPSSQYWLQRVNLPPNDNVAAFHLDSFVCKFSIKEFQLLIGLLSLAQQSYV